MEKIKREELAVKCTRKVDTGWTWWLTPTIPATQEAEIRRISVRGQAWAKARLY
jgi:hypothetical protein